MGTPLSLAFATTALLSATLIGLAVGGAVTACACRNGRAFVRRDHEPKPEDQGGAQPDASPRRPTRVSRDGGSRGRSGKNG